MTTIIVDQSNVLYRAYYSGSYDTIHPWMGVVRYLNLLRNCAYLVKSYSRSKDKLKYVFAGESEKKLARTSFSSKYKANRTHNKEERLVNHRDMIKQIHKIFKWRVRSIDHLEADDVIASFAQKLHLRDNVVLFSNDKDMRQLLEFDNVKIYEAPGRFYTKALFVKEYGFPPEKFIFYKALVGDKSDNVPGVSGWGPVKSKKHVILGSWMAELSKEEKDQYWYAMELVRLRYKNDIDIDEVDYSQVVLTEKETRKVIDKANSIYGDGSAGSDILVALFQLEESSKT